MSGGAVNSRGISGLVPWFGGKRAMASIIVEQLCWRGGKVWKPGIFVEPFCGSMAVSLAMPRVGTHIVNDLHRDLINLAIVMASYEGQRLIQRASMVLSAEHVHDEAVFFLEHLADDLEPAKWGSVSNIQFEWALAYLVAAWLGKGGIAGTSDASTKGFASRYGPGGGSPGVRWDSVVGSLRDMIDRVRPMVIHNEDAFELLGKVHDTNKTAMYLDPPYLAGTRVHGRYRHDLSDAGGATMFGVPDDHERLSDALNRFEHARIVVSYEDHPRLAELYPSPRWTKIVLNRHKNLSVAGGVGGGGDSARVDEVLLVNGDVKHDGGGS